MIGGAILDLTILIEAALKKERRTADLNAHSPSFRDALHLAKAILGDGSRSVSEGNQNQFSSSYYSSLAMVKSFFEEGVNTLEECETTSSIFEKNICSEKLQIISSRIQELLKVLQRNENQNGSQTVWTPPDSSTPPYTERIENSTWYVRKNANDPMSLPKGCDDEPAIATQLKPPCQALEVDAHNNLSSDVGYHAKVNGAKSEELSLRIVAVDVLDSPNKERGKIQRIQQEFEAIEDDEELEDLRTLQRDKTTPSSTSDFRESYKMITEFMYGMNQVEIDMKQALALAETKLNDPVMVAMQAYIYWINGIDDAKAESLWLQSKDIGLLQQANGGCQFAQIYTGVLFNLGIGDPAPNHRNAKRWFTRAADQGNADAQTKLGFLYEKGQTVGNIKDLELARYWYKKAARKGHAVAQNNLGCLYQAGLIGGKGKDFETAFKWFAKAAKQGHAGAQNSLGCLYRDGLVGDKGKDIAMAAYWYEKAAERGNASGQNNLGYLYQYTSIGGLKGGDFDMARHWYEKAAAQGHPSAQNNIGYLYRCGSIGGKGRDYDMARRWYEKAAVQNNASAQNNLGCLYRDGLVDGKPDYEKASRWFERAANLGNASAQNHLGFLYQNGQIGDMNEEESFEAAIFWFKRAAAQGYAKAQNNLGNLYTNGHSGGQGRDYAQARHYYERAAAQGHALAQNNLGFLFENGLIGAAGKGKVALDDETYLKMARHWYERAAAQGFFRAIEALERMQG